MHNREGGNVIQENTGSDCIRGKRSLLTIFIAAAAILIAILPAFRSGVYVHGDLGFHLGRIESLYEGLRAGVFPLKVHFTLANGYGYGEGFFYPDALLYYPALLRFTGLSLGGLLQGLCGYGDSAHMADHVRLAEKAVAQEQSLVECVRGFHLHSLVPIHAFHL